MKSTKKPKPNILIQHNKMLGSLWKSKEGYWTSEKFMKQIKESAKLAEYKFPKEDDDKIAWIFDHSSCHGAYSEDLLNAYKMKAKPGGKQPVIRNTVWQGILFGKANHNVLCSILSVVN